MLVHQPLRFELDPSDRARAALSSHCGASRFAYNWGLQLVKARLDRRDQIRSASTWEPWSEEQTDEFVRSIKVPWSLPALRREWNSHKEQMAPWWRENSKEAYNSGLDALTRALQNFSETKGGQRKGTMGFPKRKKHHARRSCRFTTGAIAVVDCHHVQLPRLGHLRTKEPTTKLLGALDAGRARILSATIAEEAGRWFVSFTCEVQRQDPPAAHPNAVIGVDLGVEHLATLSTGGVVVNPKALSRYARRTARLKRELARQKMGSGRRRRTKAKVARCHRKVVNVRRDAIHRLTSDLARTYDTVVVEDLNIKGMTAVPKPALDPEHAGQHLANGRRAKAGLNRSILDAGLGEVRRQLTYKLAWHGGRLIVADRFFPSSKTCSSCGAVKAKLALDERVFQCQPCGLVLDRDHNAAKNLAAYGRLVVAGRGPETPNARGGGHPRHQPKPPVKREDGTGRPGEAVTASSQEEAAWPW